MPKSRAAAAATPVRESPRKRKRVDQTSEETAVSETSQDSKRGRTERVVTKTVQKSDKGQTSALSASTGKPAVSKGKKAISTSTKSAIQSASAEIELEDKPSLDIDNNERVDVIDIKDANETQTSSTKVQRKRKTKEDKEAEAMPLAARTVGLNMFVGAHVSIAKGLENAVTNSLHIGGNAFALFLKSQRKWENPALKDENRDAFRSQCKHHKYDSMSHVVPHGSYLVNLATPDKDKSKQSYNAFVDDLRRCEALGIKYYNFHPGATNQEPLDEAIGRLAENLNRALSETSTVVPLLENMAGGGSVIGSRFTDLRDIIAKIKPEFKTRIGICIDTCHTLAAGYDLRSPEAYSKTMQELDETVGLKYLKALHINDSKAPLGSKRDLHQNIGLGFLGLRAFHNVMNDVRLQDMPLVLETPCERPDPKDATGKKTIDDKNVYAREIKLLESLIGMDAESEEFKELEAKLSAAGAAERDKMSASISVKEEKASKKLEKARAKDQKSVAEMFGGKNSKKAKGKKTKAGVSSGSELSDLDSDS